MGRARRVFAGRWTSAELLGPGDVWTGLGAAESGSAVAWEVCTCRRSGAPTAVLAIMDGAFVDRCAVCPAVLAGVLQRSRLQAHRLAVIQAYGRCRNLPERIHRVLWEIGTRSVVANGAPVLVPVVLSHRMLGEIVGAARQSVTSALSQLQARGLLVREGSGWELSKPPARAAPVVSRRSDC